MNILKILIVTVFGLGLGQAKSADSTVFSPTRGVSVSIAIEGPRVDYEIRKAGSVVSHEYVTQTENPLKLVLADYNFDGYKDFSVFHIDDGMGTYTVHYIFVYSPKANTFVELIPKCGHMFANLVRNKKGHTLSHMYYVDNVPTTCTRKY
jgi:hypothetical protein